MKRFPILVCVLFSQNCNYLPDSDSVGSGGKTSLVALLTDGKLEKAKRLLAAGADPNLANEHGDSPLIWATNRKNPELVQAILAAGGRVNHKGSGGRTALHWACTRSAAEVLPLLVAAGATLDEPDNEGETALMKAARLNNLLAISFLLKQGADPNRIDNAGKTALMKAIEEEYAECVERLVLANTNLDLLANNGKSALSLALALDHRDYLLTPAIEKKLPHLRKKMLGLLTLIDNRGIRPLYDPLTMAARIHVLVNAERVKHHLKPLEYDEQLAGIASDHSRDMNERHFFNHENPDKEDPSARARRANYDIFSSPDGVTFRFGIGENIYQSSTFSSSSTSYDRNVKKVQYNWTSSERLAVDAVEGWMNSPGHRANILRKDYLREGIGIAIDKNEKISITQDFW